MAQDENFVFSDVIYRATAYRTGTRSTFIAGLLYILGFQAKNFPWEIFIIRKL